MSIKGRTLLAAGLAVTAAVAGIGLLGGQPWASAAGNIGYDTGSGLTFVVNATNGNLTSLKHNGTELAAPGRPPGSSSRAGSRRRSRARRSATARSWSAPRTSRSA